MAERHCYRDVLPFSALVTMECVNVGLNTLFKAATLKGMSYHVFVVYAYAVAAIILFPASIFSQRSRVLPPFTFRILSKTVFLGLIGCSSQIMGYTGINYSSPTLASSISNLVPAFTFLLAIIFRMEKVALRSPSSQAKVLGTLVSISGAFVMTLYKGPPIIINRAPALQLHLASQNSLDLSWAMGGLLLMGEYTLVPLWYIVQTQIMKEYPNELTVIFIYNLCVSSMATVVGVLTETNPSAWALRPNIALASVLCSGIFGSLINNTIHAWALHLKGPVFVAMFKPLSIAIAVAMGVIFLGDTLHLGSLAGAAIISIGFYSVMWGKAKEETDNELEVHVRRQESLTSQNTPLLQSYKNETDDRGHVNV